MVNISKATAEDKDQVQTIINTILSQYALITDLITQLKAKYDKIGSL